MSTHRPTATLEIDVFADDLDGAGVEDTPANVARLAWSNVVDWVNSGYQPVLTVRMADGTEHTVDLEEETSA